MLNTFDQIGRHLPTTDLDQLPTHTAANREASQVASLTEQVRSLEGEIQRVRDEAEAASNRADDLAGQLRLRDQTLAWIYSSKVYRLSRMGCKALDVVLAPLRALRGGNKTQTPLAPPPPASDPAQPLVPTVPAATKFDIIRLPVIDWEFRFQRPQQLMRELARDGHRVFYARTALRAGPAAADCQRLMANVYGTSLAGPAHLNLYKDRLDDQAVEELMASFDLLRRREGIHQAICIVDLPFWAPLALAMRDRWGIRVIYDCMDDHAGFSTNDKTMTLAEDSLIRDADLVITTAKLLTEKARAMNERVLPLPNAGEFGHFHKAFEFRQVRPDQRPVVGYFGAISDWFDVEMVVDAARARPDWRFLLIGGISGISPSAFATCPNIELRGEVPYSDLPQHLREFDVACIPFRDTELTRATNPVKFFEYLSAGKPVVSSDLIELRPYAEHYEPTNGAGGFVGAVERALSSDSLKRAEARLAIGRENTWASRAGELSARLTAMSGHAAIIVVSYQNPEYMRQCVESLFSKTIYPNFEVIVVDNASEAPVVDFLKEYASTEPRLRLILNDENLGFAKANNQGIRAAADSDYIVLLNNDTIVPPGWLCGLVRYLQNPQVGMVGPVTSFAGNEARIRVDYQAPDGIDEFARAYTVSHAELHFDIRVLAMFCVGIRKSVVDEVGLLDERYVRGMFEDDDYAVRIRAAGYRTVCAEDVFVHHWGEGSFGKIHRPEYLALFDLNKQRFEEKWQRAWVPHVARSWHQDEPPLDRLKPFRVDLRLELELENEVAAEHPK